MDTCDRDVPIRLRQHQGISTLLELCQHPVRSLGVEKRHEITASADSRFLVYQARPCLGEARESAFEILDLETDMVDSLATFLKESGYTGAVFDRRDELHGALSDGKLGHLYSLVFDNLSVNHFEPEEVLPMGDGGVEVTDDNSEVIDFTQHEVLLRNQNLPFPSPTVV